ncbi:MAG TPA: lmo0937 family membrane protein [Pyrinomonadaceae bacterium]|nr:lmo0937 family membrane protein [Pyrinomonadaceae bacterium]
MLWTILVVLLILWLIGFGTGVVGNLIHLVLVIALVLLVINLITGRRTV